jgi:hypothetical protein
LEVPGKDLEAEMCFTRENEWSIEEILMKRATWIVQLMVMIILLSTSCSPAEQDALTEAANETASDRASAQ